MKKTTILHPFLLALYPPLFLYAFNIHLLYPSVVVKPLIVTFICTLVIWLILNLITKNIAKSGALVSVFLLLFFSYKHYLLTFIGIFHNGLFTRDEVLFPIWVVLCLSILFLIFKAKGELKNLTICLNIISITLIAFPLTNIVTYELTKRYPFSNRIKLIKTITENPENIANNNTKKNNRL